MSKLNDRDGWQNQPPEQGGAAYAGAYGNNAVSGSQTEAVPGINAFAYGTAPNSAPGGEMPPNMAPNMPPNMPLYPFACHPGAVMGMYAGGFYPYPPPYWGHPGSYPYPLPPSPEMAQEVGQGQLPPMAAGLMAQAQGVVDNLMGEQAGMFKSIISTLGIDDNEFWKGAMIGAAAALLLSNENVRTTLLNVLGNATDTLKSASGKVKEVASSTVGTAKEGMNASGKIFRDTVKASKEGFEHSMAELRQMQQQEKRAKRSPAKAVAKQLAPKKTAPKKVAVKKATPRKTAPKKTGSNTSGAVVQLQASE